VFNLKGEILLQKRAAGKYHSGGLWTNACCGHPKPGEKTLEAAQKRLQEEMGFTCDLERRFSFVYKKEFDNGLTEHEFDHVFVGTFDGEIEPDPGEVEEWKWVAVDDLLLDVTGNPEKYSYWFREILGKLY